MERIAIVRQTAIWIKPYI